MTESRHALPGSAARTKPQRFLFFRNSALSKHSKQKTIAHDPVYYRQRSFVEAMHRAHYRCAQASRNSPSQATAGPREGEGGCGGEREGRVEVSLSPPQKRHVRNTKQKSKATRQSRARAFRKANQVKSCPIASTAMTNLRFKHKTKAKVKAFFLQHRTGVRDHRRSDESRTPPLRPSRN